MNSIYSRVSLVWTHFVVDVQCAIRHWTASPQFINLCIRSKTVLIHRREPRILCDGLLLYHVKLYL